MLEMQNPGNLSNGLWSAAAALKFAAQWPFCAVTQLPAARWSRWGISSLAHFIVPSSGQWQPVTHSPGTHVLSSCLPRKDVFTLLLKKFCAELKQPWSSSASVPVKWFAAISTTAAVTCCGEGRTGIGFILRTSNIWFRSEWLPFVMKSIWMIRLGAKPVLNEWLKLFSPPV